MSDLHDVTLIAPVKIGRRRHEAGEVLTVTTKAGAELEAAGALAPGTIPRQSRLTVTIAAELLEAMARRAQTAEARVAELEARLAAVDAVWVSCPSWSRDERKAYVALRPPL